MPVLGLLFLRYTFSRFKMVGAESLWDSTDVIRELFDNYEKLSPALKVEIPLKQIWILSEEE